MSLRWLSGSVLTGFTSLLLMGGALYAALDGRQQLATPANTFNEAMDRKVDQRAVKGEKVVEIVALEPAREKILQVPTVTREGDNDVIRKKPFAYAAAPLAIVASRTSDYPKFNPLNVFSASKQDRQRASSDTIYSANVEGEVTLKTVPFDLPGSSYTTTTEISDFEAEMSVRESSKNLDDGNTQTAALPYLDPSRFELSEQAVDATSVLSIKVTAENVTRVEPTDSATKSDRHFSEEVVVISRPQKISDALTGIGASSSSAATMSAAVANNIGASDLTPGTRMRVAWEKTGDSDAIELHRVSVYRDGKHAGSIALDDKGNLVRGKEPVKIAATDAQSDDEKVIATVSRANLPTTYDGIYRAALSQGLNKQHARRIVRTVAFDVDFRQRISAKDELEVFYSVEDGEDKATDNSEILYIGLTLKDVKRRYYRFRADKDGTVDYYDENGKSAKKFLLRRPVPNGKFRSAFGPRRHPISRRIKMHNGVDFSAPRGTPILSAGNGVVVKAGWAGGCGKKTEIRHANGYKTIYCHQSRILKGIKPGARVRIGQMIGRVGSTGYSTGPHLHYEVAVNGRKVNPMKIRLPKGRVLKGQTLKAFKKERARIDALLDRSRDTETTLASL